MSDLAENAASGGLNVKKRRRVFEVVYDQIRDRLASGALKPGDKLPPERDLAEQLGFSRAAVREALRALEANGVVQLQMGIAGGAFIHSGDREIIGRSINDLVVLGSIPLRHVMEVRSLLLARAVQLACERADSFDAVEANILAAEQSIGNEAEYAKHVRAFYSILGELSGNSMLATLVDATTAIALDFVQGLRIEVTPELFTLRRNVLGRLRARDSEGAARAIAENIAFLHGYTIARAAQAKAASADAEEKK